MKRKIILLIFLVFILALSNIVTDAYLRFASIRVYDYQSLNTEFTFQSIPAKGHDLEKMLAVVQNYDQLHSTHTTICRKFSINYLKFWRWYDYYRNPYYKFPQCPD